jgi:outer membrane beta-barrel protein
MTNRLLIALLSLGPATAFAQTEELENPGSVSAVQMRPYRMASEINLAVGLLPLDAFNKTVYGQVSFVYHFTDGFAWEVGRGSYGYNWDTGLKAQLERDYGVLPTAIDLVQFFVGSDLMFTPFFGKTAVLNKAVLFYEAYLLVGATVYKYTSAFRPAVNIGGGVRLFQSKYVSFRLEATDDIVITSKPYNVMAVNLMLCLNFGSSTP